MDSENALLPVPWTLNEVNTLFSGQDKKSFLSCLSQDMRNMVRDYSIAALKKEKEDEEEFQDFKQYSSAFYDFRTGYLEQRILYTALDRCRNPKIAAYIPTLYERIENPHQVALIRNNPEFRTTPLTYVSGEGKVEALKALLSIEPKINPSLCDANGDSPLVCAIRGKHFLTVKMLLEAEADPYLSILPTQSFFCGLFKLAYQSPPSFDIMQLLLEANIKGTHFYMDQLRIMAIVDKCGEVLDFLNQWKKKNEQSL
jgi:hypothetical protein